MQTHNPKYSYEVHIAGYGETDWAELPKPFFLNEVIQPNTISTIVTAELKDFSKALLLFDHVREWCDSQESFRINGCRITLEQMVQMTDLEGPIECRPLFNRKEWKINHNAFIPFSDVHADGIWNPSLYTSLVNERGYIPLDYVTRRGKELSVLTLHFLYPELAVRESKYLQGVLQTGGFQGTLSVENTLAVAVIGPPVTRPVIVNKS